MPLGLAPGNLLIFEPMNRPSFLVLGIICLLFFLIFLSLFGSGYFLGTHTSYCPLRHKISDTAVCVILHKDQKRILVQHADLDINEYFLEIFDGHRSHFFKMPSVISQLAPGGYKAELIPGQTSTILINGKPVVLDPR